MKFMFTILLFISVLYPQTPQEEWWAAATSSQRATIRNVYERNKVYNKAFTLAAFSIVESSGGIHLLNVSEASGGYYAQKAFHVAQRVYTADSPTPWQVSRVLQKLITDRDFDDFHARANIDELLDRYGGRWMMVWKWWNSHRPGQAEEVRAWVRFLHKQFK